MKGRHVLFDAMTAAPPQAPFWLLAVATAVLAVVLGAIVRVDVRAFRIPDLLSLPLLAAGLAMAFWRETIAATLPADHLIGAIAGYLLLAGIGEAFFRLRGVEGLGLGDAKLFAAAGAWLGWQSLPLVLLIAAFGGLAQALVINRGQPAGPLAFGPWISLGFMAVWLYQLLQLGLV